MARVKAPGRKQRLFKAGRQTKWAPIWIVLRAFGVQRSKHVHPARLTEKKRHWRRDTLKR